MASIFEGRPSDIVLLVVGGIGAGKSQFINYVLEQVSQSCGTRMQVCRGLSQGTRVIQPIRLSPRGGDSASALGRVVLVDGPGFEDNDAAHDHKVISGLSGWVARTYDSMASTPPSHRCGIIYVQDITLDPLITNATTRNLEAAFNLAVILQCGHIHFVTMKWSKGRQVELGRAETALCERTWKTVVEAGLPISRIEAGKEGITSLSTVEHFLDRTQEDYDRNLHILRTLRASKAPTARPPGESADELLPGCGQEGDIVILLMGPLKSGKSSFVNDILAQCGRPPYMQVAEDMTLGTKSVNSAIVETGLFRGVGPNRRVILVDIPGFEADSIANDDVLRKVNQWLRERFDRKTASCGVLYLHDISQDAFPQTADRIFKLFPILINRVSLKQVVIATTKWDKAIEVVGTSRELELTTTFWRSLRDRGFLIRRLGQQPETLEGALSTLELLNEMFPAFSV